MELCDNLDRFFLWGYARFYIHNYPSVGKKLILIVKGPCEEKYAVNIMKTRIRRLGKEDWESFLALNETLNNPSAKNRDEVFCSFGKLMSGVDAVDSHPHENELLECSYDAFKEIFPHIDFDFSADLRITLGYLKISGMLFFENELTAALFYFYDLLV
ncbi:hypothetical protein [Methanosarcina siciliae]|nr:hypothetical protein [Methanosarcina siciliae]